jgi:hypothetical protein
VQTARQEPRPPRFAALHLKRKTIMTTIKTLTTQDAIEWMHTLARCARYDFYHLPEYHVIAEENGEGTGRLFVYEEGAYTIALPLLLRDLEANRKDATSVYGYAGPVCSHDGVPDAVVRNFQAALARKLRDLGIVTLFSRLHPLLSQQSLLAGLGQFQLSTTVSIDLTLDPAVQAAKFRKDHKAGIRKLRKLGITVVDDVEGRYLDDFIRIYHETMRRVDARGWYFFSPTYFHRLWETLRSHGHLFVCLQQQRVISAGLFMTCQGIIQYHLSGSLNEALKIAPMKLLLDEVRLWGTQQGFHVLHLGGGTSADPNDSLLHYKLGFSDRTHKFSTWRWVLAQGAYDQLCLERAQWNEQQHLQPASADFFPAYRCPAEPRVVAGSSDSTPPQGVGRAVERVLS